MTARAWALSVAALLYFASVVVPLICAHLHARKNADNQISNRNSLDHGDDK